MEVFALSFIPMSVIGGVANSEFYYLLDTQGTDYPTRSL